MTGQHTSKCNLINLCRHGHKQGAYLEGDVKASLLHNFAELHIQKTREPLLTEGGRPAGEQQNQVALCLI